MPFNPILLVHAASSINNVISFIEGVSFLEALSVIGDNDVQAAKLAMQHAEKAHDVKREVTLAVGHLQSAHTAYRATWQQIYNSDFSKWTRTATMELVIQKDIHVLSLLALCYAYLKEFQLVQNCVSLAKEAKHANDWNINDSIENKVIQGIGTLLREPGKVIEYAKMEIQEVNLNTDLEAFSKAIEQYH